MHLHTADTLQNTGTFPDWKEVSGTHLLSIHNHISGEIIGDLSSDSSDFSLVLKQNTRRSISFFFKSRDPSKWHFLKYFLQNIHYICTHLIYSILELKTQKGKLLNRKWWASGNAVQPLKVTSKPAAHKVLQLHYKDIISKGITKSSGRLVTEAKFRRVSLAILLWASVYMAQQGSGKYVLLQCGTKSVAHGTV